MARQHRTVERVLEGIASKAHGVVSRAEALAAAISDDQIRHRLRTGTLLREYPGVYRVGHRAPSIEARYMTAVKACGEGAVLSGLSAAHLLGLVNRVPSRPQVTTPTERRIRGIRVRRARRGLPEATTYRRIPVTTVARTLTDVAPSLSPDALARACHEATVRYQVTPEQVEAVLARRPTTPGAAKLRRVLHGDVRVTLSGLSAAHLLGLVKRVPSRPQVTTPTERRIRGIRVRRARHGLPEATTYRGIPVTTVARTLIDIAPSLSPEALARACHEATVRYHVTPEQVEAVLARRPTSPGATKLRRVLHGDVKVTLSKLERRFLTLLSKEGLKLPETNASAGGRRVDCRWPEEGLTVELDGYRYHRSRYAWEQDRRREREARARGDEFRRYTYGDVFEQPQLMLSELRSVLPPDRPG